MSWQNSIDLRRQIQGLIAALYAQAKKFKDKLELHSYEETLVLANKWYKISQITDDRVLKEEAGKLLHIDTQLQVLYPKWGIDVFPNELDPIEEAITDEDI